MGQKLGKPVFLPEARPFLNCACSEGRGGGARLRAVWVERSARLECAVDMRTMEEVWHSYNDAAEGFGLSVEDLRKVCDVPSLHVTREEVDRLFRIMDTDHVCDAAAFGVGDVVRDGVGGAKRPRMRGVLRCTRAERAH
jgi:hypothetical protein